MRLRLEDGAVLGPDAIVPVAEKLGLIELIDRARAGTCRRPARRGAELPPVDERLDGDLARARDWFERLRDRLAAAPGAAERLIVEIVETQAIDNVAEVIARCSARDQGARRAASRWTISAPGTPRSATCAASASTW